MNTRCAGSDVLADPPFFDFMAPCPGCWQLVHIRRDGELYRFIEHSREVECDPASDRMYVPEFPLDEEAA